MAYRVEIPRSQLLVRCGDRQLAVANRRPRIYGGGGHPATGDAGRGTVTDVTGLLEQDRPRIRNIFIPLSCGLALGNGIVAACEMVLEPSPMRVLFLRDGAEVGAWDIDASLSSAEEPLLHVAMHGEGLRMDLGTVGARVTFDSIGLLSAPLLEMAQQFHPTLGHFPLILCRRPIGSSTTSFVLEGHRVPDDIVKSMLPANVHAIIGYKAVFDRPAGNLPLKSGSVLWPTCSGTAREIN